MARDSAPTVYINMFICRAKLDNGHFKTSSNVKIEIDAAVGNGDLISEYIHSNDHYQGEH